MEKSTFYSDISKDLKEQKEKKQNNSQKAQKADQSKSVPIFLEQKSMIQPNQSQVNNLTEIWIKAINNGSTLAKALNRMNQIRAAEQRNRIANARMGKNIKKNFSNNNHDKFV